MEKHNSRDRKTCGDLPAETRGTDYGLNRYILWVSTKYVLEKNLSSRFSYHLVYCRAYTIGNLQSIVGTRVRISHLE